MPINLLERDGLECAAWAKANGLRVLANRPLNATKDNLMFRLATQKEPGGYFGELNELLSFLEEMKNESIFTLIGELDNYKHRFGWVGEYQDFLMSKVIPHVRQELMRIEDDYTRENLTKLLMDFFLVYEDMVKYECSKQTKRMLEYEGHEITDTIEKTALHELIDNADIDYILVGMRKVKYVNALLDV
jgi:hypothetical protein